MVEMWWIWIAAGLGLAILEVLIPGFLFAGFAVGAVITGVLIWLSAGLVMDSLAVSILIFAVISVIAWLAMRAMLGVRKGQMKRIDHDINED